MSSHMNILYKNAGNILCIGKYIKSFYDKEYILVTKNSNTDIYDVSDILRLFDISNITDIKTKSNISSIDTEYYNDIIISFINYNKYNEDNTYSNFKLDCINNNIAEKISKYLNIKNEIDSDTLIFKEANITEFVGYALNAFDKDSFNVDIYNKYTGIISNNSLYPNIFFYKDNINAVIPHKTHYTDVGYDLTLISVKETISPITKLYDTGLKISIDSGFYCEVVPRSSIIRKGYILSNNIGIIDNTYRGNIYVALTKIDDTKPDLELPSRCCQLIIRKQYYANINVVLNLNNTDRGTGGFGSTGK